MSIKTKLLASFGTIIFILIVLATYSSIQISKVNDDYSYLIDDRVHKVVEVGKIQNASSLQGLYLRSYVLRQSDEDLEKLYEQRKIVAETVEKIESLFRDASMIEQFKIVKEQQQLYSEYVDQVIDYVDKKQLDEAYDVLFNNAVPANVAIQDAINTIIDFQTEQMNTTKADTTSHAEISIIIQIVIAALSAIVSILLTIIIVRNISAPLNKLTKAAKVMATGDLREEDVSVKTKDEINDLAQAFNTMKNNLAHLIGNVSANVSQTTAAAEQLAASTQEIAHASKDVANSVELLANNGSKAAATGQECAAATDDTAKGVGRIAEAAQTLLEQTINTRSISEEGGKTIKTVEQQMKVIQQSSYETKEKIRHLSSQSAEIENITNVITNITEQTNLLALNAAIEAARAGEHGKGFSVVADEVRKLAEESKNSAQKIIELTSQIQTGTKEVENSVNLTVQNVDQGVEYLQDAQVAFNDILDAITTMSSQIEEISASTEEISASTEEVAASVSEMANLANHAAEQSNTVYASVEEQTASLNEINDVAKSLSDGARMLQEEVSQFKVLS
ncbi:methyl-accepting chemotaxis protein [Ureibacillus sp. FSL W7-1570]|uniref:methyl-accepting chemotaxis protein n=1 Tax=Ureibacillus sp. FSL W7-1570 TaxID=2954593 RepID=UPI00315AE78E